MMSSCDRSVAQGLAKLFSPRSVVLVGASRQPGKVGHDILDNLLKAGYTGSIYPVNPKAEEVLGLKCYPSVSEVPGPVDLAVIVIPAPFVLDTMRECAQKGAGAAVVISAGFREAGPQGEALEADLAAFCRQAGIRMVGLNCLGVIDSRSRLNASFASGTPPEGNIAFLSQSGAFGSAIIDWALGAGVGFSKFLSIGNKADLDESALIAALGEDEQTTVIAAYLESVKDGRAFVEVASRTTRSKPVVVLKVGTTAAGARAASSHTGALAGSDVALGAALRKAGVLRARTVEEFFDYAVAFGLRGGMAGPNVAVVTNAGGPGVVATDAIARSCLSMATLAPETEAALASVLPPAVNVHNPVDVLGDAGADRYRAALDVLACDKGIDGLLVLLTPQTTTDVPATAQVVADVASRTSRPVMAAFLGGERVAHSSNALIRRGVPTFPYPERAVQAMAAMYEYSVTKRRGPAVAAQAAGDGATVRRVLDAAFAAGRDELGELEAREVLTACGFRVPRCIPASDEDAAVAAARELGFPAVVKISSPDILHKSDVGGVKVGLRDAEAVRGAFRAIMESARAARPKARLHGVLVQEMLSGGQEVILGMNRDPQFGPLIMFGLGGIYVEILKDVSFRLAPLSADEAREMTEEVRAGALLRGARGAKPSDVEAVVAGLCRLSRLACDFPQIAEMDVNPLIVFAQGEGAVALDARLRLARA